MNKILLMAHRPFYMARMMAVMFAVMTVSLTSCSGEDDIELPEIDPVVASISHKWVNKDTNSKYESFEFQTDGTFIVTERISTKSAKASSSGKSMTLKVASLKDVNLPASPFYSVKQKSDKPELRSSGATLSAFVGKYVIQGDYITLTDYGLIEAFRASNDEFEFTFKPDGSVQSITFVGTKEPTINDSKRTTLMCRMWDIESIKMSGGSGALGSLFDLIGAGFDDLLESLIRFEVDGKQVSLCAMMSKAGTYLSIFRDDEGNYFTEIVSEDLWGTVSTVVGTWSWADSKETKVNWAQTASFGADGGSGVFEITKLNLEKFVITGGDELGLGFTYEESFKAANKF